MLDIPQLESVNAVIGRALRGTGGVVSVEGPLGTGRTTLLRSAVSLARGRGMDAVYVSGSVLEEQFAFGVLEQVFGSLGRVPPDGLTSGYQMAGIALFSEIAAALTVEPLLVAIDDVQWCDRASLHWLGYAARRTSSLPIVLVLGRRSGEAGESPGHLSEVTDGHRVRIQLADWGLRDSEQRLRMLTGGALLANDLRRVAELSGGNPYLLHELAAAVETHVAPAQRTMPVRQVRLAVADQVAQRVLPILARTSEHAADIVRAVVVLGVHARSAFVAELCGVSLPVLRQEVARLVTLGVLSQDEPTRLRHPVMTDVVRCGWDPAEQSRAHLRAAYLLHEDGGGAHEVLGHLIEADRFDDDWALDTLLRLAPTTAGPVAAEALRAALRQPLPADIRSTLLACLGTTELGSDVPGSVAHLTRAVELNPELARHSDITFGLAHSLFTVGDHRKAVDVVGGPTGPLPGSADTVEVHEASAMAVALNALAGQFTRRDAARMSALRRAHRSREPGSGDPLWMTPALVALRGCLSDQPTPGSRALLAAVHASGVPAHASYLSFLAAFAMTVSEDLPVDDVLALHPLCLGRGAGQSPLQQCYVRTLVARAALATGRLVDAVELSRAALETLSELGIPSQRCAAQPALATLVRSLVATGGVAEARGLLHSAGLRGGVPDGAQFVLSLWARGELHFAAGEHGDAVRDFQECGRRLDQVRSVNPGLLPWRSAAARALAAGGDVRSAAELARAELELAESGTRPVTLGRALRVVAVLGDDATAPELLQRSVTVLEGTGARLELAYTLAEWGRWALRREDRKQARSLVRRARSLAGECGASGFVAELEIDLRSAGARKRNPEYRGVGALSGQERRVAELAKAGRSNGEIAARLHLVRRTVEAHLTSAYNKLGISGREELADVLE